jgi:transposase-like protein
LNQFAILASIGLSTRQNNNCNASSKVSRLEVISTGARRRWTLAEKQRIVAESQAGRRQVSATARRYSLSVSQLFTWCRLAREGRLFEGDRECETIMQPPAPFHVTPRGFAGPSLLAMILFEKFSQHQPLNRQSERYRREGIDLSVSTLADKSAPARRFCNRYTR